MFRKQKLEVAAAAQCQATWLCTYLLAIVHTWVGFAGGPVGG